MLTRTYKDCVEFREPTHAGTRVVRVLLDTPTPRVSCFVERHRTDTCSIVPMTIYWDELVKRVEKAVKLQKGGVL